MIIYIVPIVGGQEHCQNIAVDQVPILHVHKVVLKKTKYSPKTLSCQPKQLLLGTTTASTAVHLL